MGCTARGPPSVEPRGPRPPTTRRGVEFHIMASVGWDWLTVTLFVDPERAAELAGDLLGQPITWRDPGHGGLAFRSVKFGPYGLKLYSLPTQPAKVGGLDYCTVQMPGECWSWTSEARVCGVLRQLSAEGIRWQVTRVDLRVDHRLFTPAELFVRWEADVAEVGSTVRSLVKRESAELTRCLDGGCIARFGARQSTRYMRCYIRDDGQTRVELECKGERADVVVRDLMACEAAGQDVARRAVGHLLDFVDFLDFAPWGQMVGEAERAGVNLPRQVEVTVERKREWVLRQCAASVVTVGACAGDLDHWVAAIVEQGRRHLSLAARHLIPNALERAPAFA